MKAGQTLDGKYQLMKLIGSGGMAEVWQGYDPSLDRGVAVKLLLLDRIAHDEHSAHRQEFVRLFQREARTMARIKKNDHVAVVFDRGREGDVLYLVMELIDGTSLAERMAGRVRLTLEQVVRWTSDICEGLSAVHAGSVLHRDIKPANVMITADGGAVLVDFGIARFQDATRSLNLFATPLYTAPERFTGDRGEDQRADLYSLGCVVHEMLTGQPPFGSHASTAGFLMYAHVRQDYVPPGAVRTGIPPELDWLLTQLLAKDPRDRLEDAQEVARIIRRVILRDPRQPAPPVLVLGTGTGRPHVNTDYLEEIRRNELRIEELTHRLGAMADEVLDARAHQAELTGLSGDARGAAALYRTLGDDCATELGRHHRRVRDAYVAMSRWTDRVGDPET